MECPVCMNKYDLSGHTANKLSCFHVLCKKCCEELGKIDMHVECPLCGRKTHASECGLESSVIGNILKGNDVAGTEKFMVIVHNERKLIELCIEGRMSVRGLKEMIEVINKVPVERQVLILNGVSLEDVYEVQQYQIRNATLIQLLII